MKVSNITKKKSLSIPLELASTVQARLRGLMFRKACIPLLFVFPQEGIWPIHSFFVSFPFDAIYLGSEKKVASVFESVPPFTLSLPPSIPSKYLLELAPGSAKKLDAKIGDKFSWG